MHISISEMKSGEQCEELKALSYSEHSRSTRCNSCEVDIDNSASVSFSVPKFALFRRFLIIQNMIIYELLSLDSGY